MKWLSQPTRFLFFTGKGGVGKTTIAAAWALGLLEKGKTALLSTQALCMGAQSLCLDRKNERTSAGAAFTSEVKQMKRINLGFLKNVLAIPLHPEPPVRVRALRDLVMR